jgi:hypothetical protein
MKLVYRGVDSSKNPVVDFIYSSVDFSHNCILLNMLQMDTAQTYEVVAVGSIVSPGDLQIHKRYPLLRMERFPEVGVQVMFLRT